MSVVTAKREQQGTATVEAAITLPLLLFLLLAIAEGGNAIMQYNELTKAVRDAARYLAAEAALGSTGTIAITPGLASQTRNLAVYGNRAGAGEPIVQGLTPAHVTVEDVDGIHVRVSVSFDYRPILGFATLPTFGFGDPVPIVIPLQGSTTMRAF